VSSDAGGDDEPAEVDDVADGEIVRADEYLPTEDQREADKNLSVQLVVAFGIGIATVYGAVPGALATMVGPLMAVILNAMTRVGNRRAGHAAETLLDASDEAELPVAEFFDRAVADDRRHELLTRALSIAQDTALREKRRALGRALAAGVMGDDARIDEELLFMRAVGDLDEMHIRLLDHARKICSTWTASMIVARDPGLTAGIGALLGTLELHGLVAPAQLTQSEVIPPQVAARGVTLYNLTGAGREFLNRLADGPDA
jgi:hypothetical protein